MMIWFPAIEMGVRMSNCLARGGVQVYIERGTGYFCTYDIQCTCSFETNWSSTYSCFLFFTRALPIPNIVLYSEVCLWLSQGFAQKWTFSTLPHLVVTPRKFDRPSITYEAYEIESCWKCSSIFSGKVQIGWKVLADWSGIFRKLLNSEPSVSN